MNMKRSSRKKGDIGGPVVTLLLAVAGIAIAGFVIAYMMGYVFTAQKPYIDPTSVYLQYENQKWNLLFTVNTPNSGTLVVKKIVIVDDNGESHTLTSETGKIPLNYNGKDGSYVPSGIKADVTINLSGLQDSNQNGLSSDNFGSNGMYRVVLFTNHGEYDLNAKMLGSS